MTAIAIKIRGKKEAASEHLYNPACNKVLLFLENTCMSPLAPFHSLCFLLLMVPPWGSEVAGIAVPPT